MIILREREKEGRDWEIYAGIWFETELDAFIEAVLKGLYYPLNPEFLPFTIS